jgi:hypothetical protein
VNRSEFQMIHWPGDRDVADERLGEPAADGVGLLVGEHGRGG